MRNMINDLTEDIIKAFQINVGSDIEEIVEQIGGKIEEDASLLMYDGKIRKDGSNGFIIQVSPFQSQTRRRFTIAHELGHLFLHMGYQIDDDMWENATDEEFNRYGNSELEYEANEFAAALLMPRTEYMNVLGQNTQDDVVDTRAIAKYFNVSVEAASTRGRFLGVLKW